MTIFVVDTFDEAQHRRNVHMKEGGKGSLILDPDKGGEYPHLIEKLIVAEKFVGKHVADTPWKDRAEVYCVGDGGVEMLDEIEKLVPGFKVLFGPVETVK